MKKSKLSEMNYYDAQRFENIRDLLRDACTKYANNNAFIIKHNINNEITYEEVTYKRFEEEINALGTALIDLGLKDKNVAVISPNRYEWMLSYYSVVCGAGVVVPLDKSLPVSEIESSLNRSYSDAIIFDKKDLEAVKSIIKNKSTKISKFICMDDIKEDNIICLSDLIKRGKELLNKNDKRFVEAEIDNEKSNIILFTSGTTSASKAVLLSHKNIAYNVYALNRSEKFYESDVNLAFLPYHHTFGSTGQLLMLSNGVSSVFCDGIRHIASNLKEYHVSVFICVPLLLEAMYKRIEKEIAKQGKTKIVKSMINLSNVSLKMGIDIRRKLFKSILDQLGGNLRMVVSGAAAIDKNVAKGFNDFGVLTLQGYGLTETSPVIAAECVNHIKYGSVGLRMENVEVKVDEPNESGIGELIVRGPNIMQGYFENKEATDEVIINGWFHTGDLGYIDEEGYIFITGRKKNVIVLKNGKNVYPEELELLVTNLPYVSECMVFGLPKDDDLLLSVKIVYNKDYVKDMMNDISKEELEKKVWNDIKDINSNLTNYKHMKKLFLTDEPMIKTTTQKVKRYQEIEKIIKEEA